MDWTSSTSLINHLTPRSPGNLTLSFQRTWLLIIVYVLLFPFLILAYSQDATLEKRAWKETVAELSSFTDWSDFVNNTLHSPSEPSVRLSFPPWCSSLRRLQSFYSFEISAGMPDWLAIDSLLNFQEWYSKVFGALLPIMKHGRWPFRSCWS